ncbi:MAG TPA: metallophosphoesterase [Verrucomicrobiae bacterium]
MRLHIISDLHLEFAPFEMAEVDADVVVVAGDVHPGYLGLTWLKENIRNRPVVYILGNHEFYGKDIPKLTLELKERAKDSNIHILENEVVELGGMLFMGATLWTDFELNGNLTDGLAEAAFQMTDFRRIRVAPTYSKFRPRDARRIHFESVEWFKALFEKHRDAKKVVVTHHAPSRRSVNPAKAQLPINVAYASNLDGLVAGSGAKLWVHGHIHYSVDYQIGDTRVLSNPRGYPDSKATTFNQSLVVEI